LNKYKPGVAAAIARKAIAVCVARLIDVLLAVHGGIDARTRHAEGQIAFKKTPSKS